MRATRKRKSKRKIEIMLFGRKEKMVEGKKEWEKKMRVGLPKY